LNQINNGEKAISYPSTLLRLPKLVNKDIDALLIQLRKQAKNGIHVGAGYTKIPDLINCDLFNPNADLKADASNLDMFEANTIGLIESHHMIEHLSFKELDAALQEWSRVLQDNGLLILTFPDITRMAIKWLKYTFLYPVFPRPEKMEYMVQMLVGSQEHEGMFHKNIFDRRRIVKILSEYGFHVEFSYCRYPMRPTPSRLVIARKQS
jgi:predicted SAM-dependent methyltransferase